MAIKHPLGIFEQLKNIDRILHILFIVQVLIGIASAYVIIDND